MVGDGNNPWLGYEADLIRRACNSESDKRTIHEPDLHAFLMVWVTEGHSWTRLDLPFEAYWTGERWTYDRDKQTYWPKTLDGYNAAIAERDKILKAPRELEE